MHSSALCRFTERELEAQCWHVKVRYIVMCIGRPWVHALVDIDMSIGRH